MLVFEPVALAEHCVVLCTTHHRLLHEGKLQITGDAEHRLDVRDSSGALIVEGATEDEVATQGGSPAGQLLQIMGHRGGWTTDALVESSGLSASAVSSTLLVLEVEGKITSRNLVFVRVCTIAAP
jgi:predicted Rossmann fold nucleotide-binding protein DprA/Smf involved in DNA uptake